MTAARPLAEKQTPNLTALFGGCAKEGCRKSE
jgi:hypothetical protein